MSRSWSNAEKRRLVEGLCRPGTMTQPWGAHPFGRVISSRGLHEYFLEGEFENGEKFQRAHRAMDQPSSSSRIIAATALFRCTPN
ncbi:hypothetical protein PG997_014316 [Apiospora hydei]|uniref:Uncharacterized protein n=1 Tax=Apiospora hydei TaxID=1337664 RepID=A0ABR1UTF4_9PEZI